MLQSWGKKTKEAEVVFAPALLLCRHDIMHTHSCTKLHYLPNRLGSCAMREMLLLLHFRVMN